MASAANTFGEIAREFIDKRRREGLSESNCRQERVLYLTHGAGDRAATDCRNCRTGPSRRCFGGSRRRVNDETAGWVLQLAGRVFRYAVATARLASDPSRDLRGALTAPQPKHYGAIVEAKRAGELLRAIDGYEGQFVTKLAMQLAPHAFVRPGAAARRMVKD